MLSRIARLALVFAALGPVASAHAASLWTPLSSGTTDEITAIAAPSPTDIVFTAQEHIFYLNSGGTFSQASFSPSAPVFGLTAVAMSTDGTQGVAVGQHGEIYYSTDSGHTWTKDSTTQEFEDLNGCSSPTDKTTLTDPLYSVKFVPGTAHTFYATGAYADVLKSTNGGQTFSEVNKSGSGCIADPHQEFTDSVWLNAGQGYLVSDYFGAYWVTLDGFAGGSGQTTELDNSAANGYTPPFRLGVDASNPDDAWIMGSENDGEGIAYTINGGSVFANVNFANASQPDELNDLANSGLTVVSAGDNGEIWTSPDGKNFYEQEAPAPDTANDWQAVAMVPGTNEALVGGNSGELLVTAKANALPDTTAPTGTVSGPTKLSPGQDGTYHVTASDNPGGSGVNTSSFVWSIPGEANQTGPAATFAFSKAGTYTVTVAFTDLAGNSATASITITVNAPAPSGSGEKKTTTGGGTVGIYRKVKVSGAKSRYIPIYLLDKTPRKFVITLLTVKRKHKKQKTLAKLTTTLKKGHKDVHLKLPNNVKSGSYELEVRLYTTGKHSKAVGKRIKQLFLLD